MDEENDLTKLLKLFPDKDWDYNILSRNPNITWEIVHANPDKQWNYAALSHNIFLHDKHSTRYKTYISNCKSILNNYLLNDLSNIITKLL
jgi:hypothetical protein